LKSTNWGGSRENSGRPKSQNHKIKIAITLDQEVWQKIKQIAHSQNKPLSTTINEILSDFESTP